MAFLDDIFTPQKRSLEGLKPITSGGLFNLMGLGAGASGTKVNTSTALTLSSFYAAVDMLSDDIAKLPKKILFKQGDTRTNVPDHYLRYIIDIEPSLKMTAFDFWKTVEALRIIKGNAFVPVKRNNGTGKVEALGIWEEQYVETLEDDTALWYRYKGQLYNGADVLHFKGFSVSSYGLMGVGVVTYAAHCLGMYLDNQAYGQEVYKDRGLGYGVIESDKQVHPTNKKLISEGFTNIMSAGNKWRVPFLDDGHVYKNISLTPEEAEFLATNKNGVIEVCRWLNIAPHKLKDLTNANYANMYQQSVEHVQDSVAPRVKRYEQEMLRKLFTTTEKQQGYYFLFNLSVLLQGDLQAKAQFYMSMIYAGVYTRNEVRALEDKNPIDGLDEPLTPVNMQMLDFLLANNKKNLEDGNQG